MFSISLNDTSLTSYMDADEAVIYCHGNIEFTDPAIGTLRNHTGSIVRILPDRTMIHRFAQMPVSGDVRAVKRIFAGNEEYLLIGVNNAVLRVVPVSALDQ